jgi:CheY-like chemotaxis protein
MVPERTATRTVLVVDDDRDVAELTEALLTDDGYTVSSLYATEAVLVLEAVGRLEPDCVLLDSTGATRDFGTSWDLAEHLARRERPVPVVMLTAHSAAVQEAQAHESPRSQAAALAGIVSKPST